MSEHRGVDEDDPLVIDEDAAEKEFEPSVEMMVNDFDDERTLEEEEALETREGEEAEELDALNQEQDIPIEDLLKMYGYEGSRQCEGMKQQGGLNNNNGGGQEAASGEGEEADGEEDEEEAPGRPTHLKETNTPGEEDDEDSTLSSSAGAKKRPSSSSSPLPKKSKSSELSRFYESALEGRALRSTTSNTGEEEDSDGGGGPGEGGAGGVGAGNESDLEGRDFSWKKTIMIGPSFQASVPPGLSSYGDSLPYENEDKQLWDPKLLSPDEVEDYLAKSYEATHGSGGNGVGSLPLGAHIRDDEQALFLLFQCGYNYEEALRRRRMSVVSPADTMSLWSEEECRSFELGLRLYGKDFTMIQQQKVRTRSVGEIVQFYYLWKKTERHDVFANANRLEKKKYTLHPGTTDYMDRFIDEQDSSRDRSSSPNYHSLLYGSSSNSGESMGVYGGGGNNNVSNSNNSIGSSINVSAHNNNSSGNSPSKSSYPPSSSNGNFQQSSLHGP